MTGILNDVTVISDWTSLTEYVLYDGPNPSENLLGCKVLIPLLITLMVLLLISLGIYFWLLARERNITLRVVMEIVQEHSTNWFLYLFPGNRQPLIKRDDLIQEYISRKKNSKLHTEFVSLPNQFSDRTTHFCDANPTKNRYKDIKTYDQTRVVLSDRNGETNYINANYVNGYKHDKKFICTQGPKDNTISDFWRMVWEQNVEIIAMLTNLSENTKIKCARYWPERIDTACHFDEIVIEFVRVEEYSDYIVRHFKVMRKHNEAVYLDEVDTNAVRNIKQFHCTTWGDYKATELSLIRFIRHMNQESTSRENPIVTHCSAGVGRTGTLVALDILMDQLEEDNKVSIFNTVCELRHQRNTLVQSKQQYVFLYRAIIHVSLFGNSEISLDKLRETVQNWKDRGNDAENRKILYDEFQKLDIDFGDHDNRCIAGVSHTAKNRNIDILPYDWNRVTLSPIDDPSSTYINATFIEGFVQFKRFIITQDPLDDTVGDFWRMIIERNIDTIVLLSEIDSIGGTNYWNDDMTTLRCNDIEVKCIDRMALRFNIRRKIQIVHTARNITRTIVHYQHNNWADRPNNDSKKILGMRELINEISASPIDSISPFTPIVVHCSLGTDRSSIFVTVFLLVQQLRLEKKVDVCTLVKKLRHQRMQFLGSFMDYVFVHKAIAEYGYLYKSEMIRKSRINEDETLIDLEE